MKELKSVVKLIVRLQAEDFMATKVCKKKLRARVDVFYAQIFIVISIAFQIGSYSST